MKSWFNALWFIIPGSFLLVSFWSAHSVFVLHDSTIYAENGLLENMQALLLTVSSVLFLTPLVLQRKPVKLILLFCALLSCSFALRELDIERFPVHNFLILIGSGTGRNIILSVAFAALLLYAGFRFSYYWHAGMTFLRSRSGLLLILAGLFLVIGTLFEKSDWMVYHVFYEEISELYAYCFIAMSAFAANAGVSAAPAEGLRRKVDTAVRQPPEHTSGVFSSR